MSIPKRSEVENQYKWAVNDIFIDDAAWERDYNWIVEDASKESEYKGRAGASAKDLYEAIKECDDAGLVMDRVYVYAFMKYYEDTTNSTYQEMAGKAETAMSKQSAKYAFVEPEMMALDEGIVKQYIKEYEPLKLYEHYIIDCFANKEHTLSAVEEELLAGVSQISTIPKEIFSKFNDADAKFGDIKDDDGNRVTLTNGNYVSFMQSHKQSVRKEAFEKMYAQYKDYINTISAMYYGNVKQANFYANARHYASTLEMYLSGSFIPTSVYMNLVETVNAHLDKMHRYVHIRKKALGLKELHFYDIYAPMVEDLEWKVTYEEAKEIALKALAPLGEDYLAKVKEGFNNGWVDVYENTGKRSGAFSWGAYGTHPYLFLNYTNTLDDVFTLVHEMGHSMHTYYSNSSQPFIYSGYKIFVAEVASTVNEALLMQYLLKNCDNHKKKKYLLNHFFEQFKGTLYRQTMFAEFELKAHELCEAGEVLSAEKLCNMYRELNEKYFGDEMIIDEEIAFEWARIPHFYTPFYVYQYATGYSAAIAISSRILSGDEAVIKGYRKFLSGGSSLHPIELLKLCGVDMTQREVVEDALKVFGKILNQWENEE